MMHTPTIKWSDSGGFLHVIDQRWLPQRVVLEEIRDVVSATTAIREMHVRGAPLIGAVAAYGTHFALELVMAGVLDRAWLKEAIHRLRTARPTAVNLNWAVDQVLEAARAAASKDEIPRVTLEAAHRIVADELERSRLIGEAGLPLLEEIAGKKPGRPVNILTHCNAGRLCCIDYGTATAPIYLAAERGLPVHVWVDETRPQNQGARLTVWELGERNVPFTVIDDNGIPFYVAAPASSIDWTVEKGSDVPIELRDEDEVHHVTGSIDGEPATVRVTPDDAPAGNYAFDVTPARLVDGLITERGICPADDIYSLFPEFGDE